MDGFGPGVCLGFVIGFCLLLFCIPAIEFKGYAKAIEDVKSYGAEKVVARFDKDNGK